MKFNDSKLNYVYDRDIDCLKIIFQKLQEDFPNWRFIYYQKLINEGESK